MVLYGSTFVFASFGTYYRVMGDMRTAMGKKKPMKYRIPLVGRVYKQRDRARAEADALKAELGVGRPQKGAARLEEEYRRLQSAVNRFSMSDNGEIFADTDEDKGFDEIWEKCAPFTMTSFSRGLALYRAVRHIVWNGILGDVVECGVWRGGSAMIALHALKKFGDTSRRVFLYDTYEGMSEPCEFDADSKGVAAAELLDKEAADKERALVWAYAGLSQVKENILSTGYPMENIEFVKGDVALTLPKKEPRPIALLRLDTDFYESTRAELEILYPALVRNGILIIDDFGHWQGARRAVEEYFAPGRTRVPVLFHRIDYTGRMLVRPDTGELQGRSRRDYVPPGLKDAGLLRHFPTLSVGDAFTVPWPHLRTGSPHHWRTDLRNVHDSTTGVLSVEEATLLYNSALLFKGARALEVGCHLGWSAAHLLLAGLDLDIVDPQLHYADQEANVRESLEKSAPGGSYRLHAAFSPSILPELNALNAAPWSFAFIDGDHEGDAPRLDAEEVAGRMAETAMVLFHDLKSPFVAQGLRVFKTKGWNTGLFNTMQVMGVAWRGDVTPVTHISDPEMPLPGDSHLEEFTMLSRPGPV